MKLRILMEQYLVVVIILLAWWLGSLFFSGSSMDYFGLVVVIFAVLRSLLSDRQYLCCLEFTDTHLKIEYITPILRSVRIQIARQEIMHIELTRSNWLVGYPASLNIKSADGWERFQILRKKMLGQVEQDLVSRNIISPSA